MSALVQIDPDAMLDARDMAEEIEQAKMFYTSQCDGCNELVETDSLRRRGYGPYEELLCPVCRGEAEYIADMRGDDDE